MRINHQIRIPLVRLITDNGSEVVKTSDALSRANSRGLDLIEVDNRQSPPICRIADYGKMMYEVKVKEKEQKRNSKSVSTKEIQFSPNIETNDINVKVGKIRELLGQKHKVKLIMKFKGRDLQHTDIGQKTLEGILSQLSSHGASDSRPKFEGRNLSITLSPL
jgi:translation initiation factor IF-3